LIDCYFVGNLSMKNSMWEIYPRQYFFDDLNKPRLFYGIKI